MRVLMLSWEYPPHMVGGIGTHVNALVPVLAARGVEVTLVTPRWAGGEPESRIDHRARVFRVDPSLPTIGDYFADARQTNLRMTDLGNALWSQPGAGLGQGSGGFDLIHAHDWLVAFTGVSLKQLHRTPLIATIHATERGRCGGTLPWEMSRSIDDAERSLAYESWRVITVSRSMADEVRSYFGLPQDKIEVVPNGVETSRFDRINGGGLSEFRAHWARPEEKIIFFVGRMETQKGPHLLVEAAPRVLAQFPRSKFILAGTGRLEHSLKARISELGLDDKVRMTGFISDQERDELYKVADVSVFPSVYEPFGIVALEAMAAGCPVVVSDVGGLKEVVKNHETGIVVFSENIESLAWGILHTLLRPDWASKRAENAYGMVTQEYSWDRIADRTIQVYERVISERWQVEWA